MIELRSFESLGKANFGWLNANHHFSFGHYRDAGRMNWGRLRVWNDDEIAPGTGFDPHPHRDMEIITYGIDYSGAKIGEGTRKAGMEQPLFYWDPSIAPSGAMFYTGDKFPKWRGHLFTGALAGQLLARLEMRNGQVIGETRMLEREGERIRDVVQGPDGYIYLLTDDREGKLLRLVPR